MNALERIPDPDEAPRRHFPDIALEATTRVFPEQGRWVLYLGVSFWEDHEENPVQWVWHRVSDHPSRGQAEVAAHYVGRAANRDRFQPPSGS